MRISDFIKVVVKDVSKPKKVNKDMDGWIRTRDIVPMLNVKTIAGVRDRIDRIVRFGFAESKRLNRCRLVFRLSSKFKTWSEADLAAIDAERFKAPAGWVTLSQYARKERRTVRGLQYRIDGKDIPVRIFKTPRPVSHYRRSDLDRLIRKAS